MFGIFWKRLEEKVRNRVIACQRLIAETLVLKVKLHDKEYQMEYLVIPSTGKGNSQTPMFIFPGGGTDLLPCFEAALYRECETIVVSPFGYGKSDDLPEQILKNDPFHGARAALQLLRKLGKQKIVLFGHSNAAPVVAEMAVRAHEFEIEVEKVILVNPLGLRKLSNVWVTLAFSVSGFLTRLGSLGHESPADLLKGFYHPPKHPFSLGKLSYELKKSSGDFLLERFSKLERDWAGTRIEVIQSRWDWGRFHWPWTKSNEEIFQCYAPTRLKNFLEVQGLHNITLGKDSKRLAATLDKVLLAGVFFVFFHLPQLPAYICWLAKGFGFA